eukprot:COSAG03_NODE_1087_length_4849_cov_15.870526_6_plen_170_part_00
MFSETSCSHWAIIDLSVLLPALRDADAPVPAVFDEYPASGSWRMRNAHKHSSATSAGTSTRTLCIAGYGRAVGYTPLGCVPCSKRGSTERSLLAGIAGNRRRLHHPDGYMLHQVRLLTRTSSTRTARYEPTSNLFGIPPVPRFRYLDHVLDLGARAREPTRTSGDRGGP